MENIGGAEHALLDLVDRWKVADPSVEFLVIARGPIGKLQPELSKRGIHWEILVFEPWIHGIPLPMPFSQFRMLQGNSEAVLQIFSLLESYKPDLVFSNTTVAPWAALAAFELNIPHVWWLHEFIPPERFELGEQSTYEDIGALSALVLTSSQAIADHVGQWISQDKLCVCYPLPSYEVMSSRIAHIQNDDEKISELRTDNLTAVIIGQFSDAKGQWLALEAARRLKGQDQFVNLVLVGQITPDQRKSVHTFLTEHGLSAQVKITGEISEPFNEIIRADIGIVASPIEGFGRAAAEFAAAGLAVIGTSSGATPELIVDGTTGILIPPHSIEALTNALLTYILNPELAREHGLAAHDHAKTHIFTASTPEQAIQQIAKSIELQDQTGVNPHLCQALIFADSNISDYFQFAVKDFLTEINLQYRVGKWVTHPIRSLRRSSERSRGSVIASPNNVELETQIQAKPPVPAFTSSGSLQLQLEQLAEVDEVISQARITSEAIRASKEFAIGRWLIGPMRKVRRAFS